MFKKVLAVALAATMTLGMAAVASADSVDGMSYFGAGGNNTVYLYTDEKASVPGFCTETGVNVESVTSVVYTVKAAGADITDANNWYGGAVGVNAEKAGWTGTNTWANSPDETKDDLVVVEPVDGVFTVTVNCAGKYVDGEGWAQAWLQSYGQDIEITGVTINYDAPAAEEPEVPATGAAAPVAAVAVVALVSAAVVVASKKRA